MPSTLIRGGVEVEIPNRKENREDFATTLRKHEMAKARTVKPWRRAGWLSPQAQDVYVNGPDSGYSWNLKLVSVQLATSDTVSLYVTSSAPENATTPLLLLISTFGASASNQVATFSSSQVQLSPDEGLYIVASTHNIAGYAVFAEQVMAERSYAAYD